MFCPKCGADAGESKFCPKCGEPLAKKEESSTVTINNNTTNTVVVSEKSPILALILSFIIPGLGEMYDGKIGKGFGILILAIISVALTLVLIGFIMYPIVWIYSMVDSYSLAKKYNQYVIDNGGSKPW